MEQRIGFRAGFRAGTRRRAARKPPLLIVLSVTFATATQHTSPEYRHKQGCCSAPEGLLIVSSMRSSSTALHYLLASHPCFAGYGNRMAGLTLTHRMTGPALTL